MGTSIDQLQAQGETLQAQGAHRRASSIFGRIAADPTATEAQRAAARGRLDQLAFPAYWDESRYQRQLAALRMIEAGATHPEICAALDISPQALGRLLVR